MQLRHGRVSLALHRLKPGSGQPLLLLHALGASAATWPRRFLDWKPGPVFALDFAGHGESGRVRGGAYHPEYFLADADLALGAIDEPCHVLGAGVGAYVALLLAGSRPAQIQGACLLAGAGLAGVGSRPEHEMPDADVVIGIEGFEDFIAAASRRYQAGTDPFVAQCERDVRPLDYVESFARAASPLLFDARVGDDVPAPDWWQTAFDRNPGARRVEAPLAELASVAHTGSRPASRSRGEGAA